MLPAEDAEKLLVILRVIRDQRSLSEVERAKATTALAELEGARRVRRGRALRVQVTVLMDALEVIAAYFYDRYGQ